MPALSTPLARTDLWSICKCPGVSWLHLCLWVIVQKIYGSAFPSWKRVTEKNMQIICTSLQTDNHAITLSLTIYRLEALPDARAMASKCWWHPVTVILKWCYAVCCWMHVSCTVMRSCELVVVWQWFVHNGSGRRLCVQVVSSVQVCTVHNGGQPLDCTILVLWLLNPVCFTKHILYHVTKPWV